MRLADKVAIITGGGSGIGRATALLFAKEGAKVVVADCSVEGAEETVRLIQGFNGDALAVRVDVPIETEVERMVQTTVSQYGKLDILFNNAGVAIPRCPVHELPLEEWQRVISINLTGVFLGAKYGIREMLKIGGGVIINTASIAGVIGLPNIAAYGASKGGVVNLTRQLAIECAPNNIRVNCICPGAIQTPMAEKSAAEAGALKNAGGPLGRRGEPEEVAQAALFLASNDSSYVNGVILPIDGGWFAQ